MLLLNVLNLGMAVDETDSKAWRAFTMLGRCIFAAFPKEKTNLKYNFPGKILSYLKSILLLSGTCLDILT